MTGERSRSHSGSGSNAQQFTAKKRLKEDNAALNNNTNTNTSKKCATTNVQKKSVEFYVGK